MKTSSPGGRGPRLARRPRLLKWQRPLPPRPRRAQHPGRPGPRRAPGRPDTRGARCGHRPPPAPVPPRTCRTLTQAGAAAGALAVRPGPGPGAGSGRRGINRGGEDSGASPEPRCVGPPPPSCRAPRGPLPAAARGSPATSPGSRAPRGSAASTWGSSPAAPSGNQLRKSLRSRSPSLGNASCRAAGRRARRAPRGSLRSPRGRQAGAAPDEWIHVAGSAGRGRWGRGSTRLSGAKGAKFGVLLRARWTDVVLVPAQAEALRRSRTLGSGRRVPGAAVPASQPLLGSAHFQSSAPPVPRRNACHR